ncbi:class II aldolase/adducin family protein [candidate division KSB1 bacterium]|nr:MAG: class II aldolase/adducin family protein [candidate division KSB1 bacterium]
MEIKSELLYYAKLVKERGLVVGPGGNISVRWQEVMYVTPSGLAFDELSEEDLVGVAIESGEIIEGQRRPTSEVLMHLFCYRLREDVGAVVHTHPPFVISAISSGVILRPMFPDFVVYLGHQVPNIGYVTPTTAELAEAVQGAIGKHNAVTMVNHGALTVGTNLKEAYYRTEVLEEGAKIQLWGQLVGNPRFIDEKESQQILSLGSEKYRQELLRAMRA